MFIKMLGVEIRTGKDREPKTEKIMGKDNVSVEFPIVHMSISSNNNQQNHPQSAKSDLLLIKGKPHPITKAILWPALPEDPMSQTRLSILMNETNSWFIKHHSLDICSLNNYLKNEAQMLSAKAKQSYDILREMHCIEFSCIHPDVLKKIPEYYSSVLNDHFVFE